MSVVPLTSRKLSADEKVSSKTTLPVPSSFIKVDGGWLGRLGRAIFRDLSITKSTPVKRAAVNKHAIAGMDHPMPDFAGQNDQTIPARHAPNIALARNFGTVGTLQRRAIAPTAIKRAINVSEPFSTGNRCKD
jgi:hypothetical protein